MNEYTERKEVRSGISLTEGSSADGRLDMLSRRKKTWE